MLYEVTLTQSYRDQLMVNRWNYVSTGLSGSFKGSTAVLRALGWLPVSGTYPADGMLAKVQILQVDGVKFEQIVCTAVHDPLDFTQFQYPNVTGGSTGADSPPFVAFGLRTDVVRRDIRRGTKRIGGVPSEATSTGGTVIAPWIGQLGELATLMSATRTFTEGGANFSVAPVVVKKEKYNPDTGLASPTGRARRYFSDPVIQAANLAEGITWSAYDTIRSQTSRQIGRGV